MIKDNQSLLKQFDINENLELFMNFIFRPTSTSSSLDVQQQFLSLFNILIQWKAKIPEEEWEKTIIHMKPVIKATDINKEQNPKPYSKNVHYFARSVKSALIFSNIKNLREIVLKNPLCMTTYCTSNFFLPS